MMMMIIILAIRTKSTKHNVVDNEQEGEERSEMERQKREIVRNRERGKSERERQMQRSKRRAKQCYGEKQRKQSQHRKKGMGERAEARCDVHIY